MLNIFAIIIGYLLGSISPSYILGKVLRGIDIREHGTGNAGTTNAKRVLGLGPAIICAIYDLAKGLVSMWIAYLLGVSEVFIFTAGFAAIVGHVFPFYLGFRGGQGVGTAVGILLYLLVRFLWVDPSTGFLQLYLGQAGQVGLPGLDLLILAIMVLSLLIITRTGELIGIIVLPILAYFILKNYGANNWTVFSVIIITFIFGINFLNTLSGKAIKLKPALKKIKLWRLFLRPFAVIFPILYLFYSKNFILIFLGIIVLIFFIPDLVRLFSKKVNIRLTKKITAIYKKGEEKRFSSMTLFLLAAFLTFLIFEKNIAIIAVTFLIFGDAFAKFFGLQYGKIKHFGKKTFEGSLAFFAVCLVAGLIFSQYLDISFGIIIIGALVATIAEALPWDVNDNLAISLAAATSMYVASIFI